jgi:signal transduction histidine kinase
MSHELRTPLNAIAGYAELMEIGIRGPVTPQQREDLRRIQASQQHLLGLINQVLNYAKLEAGTVQYDIADVPIDEVVSAAAGLIAPQAGAKGLTLRLPTRRSTVAVRADADKVRQIMVNLLSNAVKYTNRGGEIAIASRKTGEHVRVSVRDTGLGVPADKLNMIFEPFVQVGRALNRPGEGTGLGLAISRDLARWMGGDLTVESKVGVGSTFTLTLPPSD